MKKENIARRRKAKLNNPKKDWWAKRKNKGKWIGGIFISNALLLKAQKERIELMKKEILVGKQRSGFWEKIKMWFGKIWRKISSK